MESKMNKELLEVLEQKEEILRNMIREEKVVENKTKGRIVIDENVANSSESIQNLCIDTNKGLFYENYNNKKHLKNLCRE